MSDSATPSVRNIFVGSHALTDGFRLIGFETLTEPDARQLDQLLGELQRERTRTLLIIEQSVNRIGSKLLDQIRRAPRLVSDHLQPLPCLGRRRLSSDGNDVERVDLSISTVIPSTLK